MDLANFFTQGYQQTKKLPFVVGFTIFGLSGEVVFFQKNVNPIGAWDPENP